MEACVMAKRSPSIFDGSDETLISAVQTRAFFGGVSEMWLTGIGFRG
jgi:hypothetical protein